MLPSSFSIAACRCTHQDGTPPSESFPVRNQSFPADLRHKQQDHQVTLFLETGRLSPQPILSECLCSTPHKSTSHLVSTRIRHLCPTHPVTGLPVVQASPHLGANLAPFKQTHARAFPPPTGTHHLQAGQPLSRILIRASDDRDLRTACMFWAFYKKCALLT